MDLNHFRNFLKSFNIKDEIINEYLNGKKIFEKYKDIYLVEKGFNGKKVFDSSLIFLDLKEQVPSKYLLDFIKKNSYSLRLNSRAVALKFLYSKNLDLNVNWSVKFNENCRYLVEFEGESIGYIKFENNNLINEFNLFKYLQENKI